jgi:cytochrome bd ubiquinol oxidase subunit II
MFESLTSYELLQHYWWFIVSVLASILVFLLFVQGGQTLIYKLGKTEGERNLLLNTLGRKWELTFTTLVTFGGAFFASFPLFYSTSFGGAYWVWMLLLFAFIIQAVSYEYRRKKGNVYGAKFYETLLIINGVVGTILLGAIVSTLFTGAEFSMEKMRIVDLVGKSTVISQWQTPYHGLEALWTLENMAFARNLALGLGVFFLARILGNLYFQKNIEHTEIMKRSKKSLLINSVLFLVFFLFWLVMLLISEGYALNPETGQIYTEKYKYLNNFLEQPILLIMFLLGVVGVLVGIALALFKDSDKGIHFTGPGTVLTVLALFLIAGYNNTAYYPSTFDIQSSLTIFNSSSSPFTLKVMSYVSIMVPLVLAYIWYAWRSMNKTKLTEEEIEQDSHSY